MKKTQLINIRILFLLATCLPFLAAGDMHVGEIHDAVTAGDLEKVKALIEADPTLLESKDNNGNTPLMMACKTLQVEAANYLIDKGANVNAIGRVGVTPLFCFPSDKETPLDLVQRLVDKGADVNAKLRLNRNWTVLVEYVVRRNVKMVKFLLEHGADPSIRDIEGTPLHMAINVKGREDVAAFLVESGVKLQEFSFGNTELHLVAIRGLADLVPALVKRGADVNAVNEYGHTPLFYAASLGRRKTAEALIAAGADKSAIVETNYGKAPQLTESLQEGEAYLWYLAPKGSPNTGYAVKTRNSLLVFDPRWISDSPAAGLANGYINPNELAAQKITVLIGYQNNLPDLSGLAKQIPGTNFVLNFKPGVGDEENNDMPPYRLTVAHESFSVGEIQVHTIPACQRLFGRIEGLGYLVEADGVKIFHAGLHYSDNNPSNVARFRKEIDFLKPFGPIDIAILPIKGRHLEPFAYEPYLYLIDQLSPKAIYLIGEELVTEEPKKCLDVLRARNVPVYYPEGGIAVGERFHYLRGQTPAPATLGNITTSRELTPLQAQTDYDTLRRALEEAHAGLYRHSTKAEMDRRFKAHRAQLGQPMSRIDFAGVVSEMLADIRCGHTRLMLDPETEAALAHVPMFPLRLAVENRRLVVMFNDTPDDATIRPGMEITEINGRKTEAILDLLLPKLSADGFIETEKRWQLARNFGRNYWLFVDRSVEFTIEARDIAGETVITKLVGVQNVDRTKNRDHNPVNTTMLANVTKFAGTPGNVSLRFVHDPAIAHLRVRSFSGNDYPQLVEDAFRTLAEKRTRVLILDLRGNGGGNDMYGAMIVSYLRNQPFRYFDHIDQKAVVPSFADWGPEEKQRSRDNLVPNPAGGYFVTPNGHQGLLEQAPGKLPFLGKVIVLMDGRTFSTAADVCAILHHLKRATFVGEETGGGYCGNTSGLHASVVLPNSQLTVNIPMWGYWNAVDQSADRHRGTLPDYPVATKATDLLRGLDAPWEKALNLATDALHLATNSWKENSK